MSEHQNVIKTVSKRIWILLFFRNFIYFSGIWLFAIACTVLILRLLIAYEPPKYWPALAGLLAAAAASVIIAFKKLPRSASLSALLDKTSRAGGMLMAAEDTQIQDWQSRIPAIQTPQINCKLSRRLAIFTAAACFLLLSYLIPQRYVEPNPVRQLDISSETEQLSEQIEVLEEEQSLSEEQAQQYRQKLEQIRKQAQAADPSVTWQSLDHLGENLKRRASETASSALNETEQTAQAQALAEAMKNSRDQLTDNQLSEANSALAEMAAKLAKQNPPLANKIPKELLDAAKNGSLSKEQLEKLAQALKNSNSELEAKMAKLVNAKLVDAKMLSECKKAGQCSGEGLAEFLSQCESKGISSAEAITFFCRNKGWAVNRGRDDAPMIWSPPTSEDDAKFTEQLLLDATLQAMKDSALVGTSPLAPTVTDNSRVTSPGNTASAAAAPAGAVTHQLLPRHRKAVRKYFNTSEQPPTERNN
jgi:chemotaxis protein histidine kinase CheA